MWQLAEKQRFRNLKTKFSRHRSSEIVFKAKIEQQKFQNLSDFFILVPL